MPSEALYITGGSPPVSLIEQGLKPKQIQTLMGHSSITLTFDTYGHLFPSEEDEQAQLSAAEPSVVG